MWRTSTVFAIAFVLAGPGSADTLILSDGESKTLGGDETHLFQEARIGDNAELVLQDGAVLEVEKILVGEGSKIVVPSANGKSSASLIVRSEAFGNLVIVADGVIGKHGDFGFRGANGRNAFCKIEARGLKFKFRKENCTVGGLGGNGVSGQSGSDGSDVYLVLPSDPEAFFETVSISSRGGKGGHGGEGGPGGRGGYGAECGPSCSGGRGGRGGDGGDGGHGGSVTLHLLPSAAAPQRIDTVIKLKVSLDAAGGAGGYGGAGGFLGSSKGGGANFAYSNDGQNVLTSQDGRQGRDGNSGKLLVVRSNQNDPGQEPVRETCATNAKNIEVRFVGIGGDLIEIHDVENGVHYKAYEESRAEMGGKSGWNLLNCADDVRSTSNTVAIRTGRNKDYIQLYGIERRPNGQVQFHQLRQLYRDGRVDLTVGTNAGMESVMTLLGRKRDRFHRYCWDGQKWHISVSPNAFTGGWLDCSGLINTEQVRKIIPISRS